MRTTLLIPCYDEAESIPSLCQRLRQLVQRLSQGSEVEVLFVNDGSTDGTAAAIGVYASGLPYRILTHERNKGIGAAFKTGFAASDADRIVTLDSDCTYDPLNVVGLLALLDQGYDIATGSPYHPLGEVVGVQKWRLGLSKSLSIVYWLLLPQRLYTYTSCFRAYRREVLPTLRAESNGFLCVTQLLVSGILQGAKVAELPTRLTLRRFGRSKMKIVKVIFSHVTYLPRVITERIFGAKQTSPRLPLVLREGVEEGNAPTAKVQAHFS